jgi:hypothetical protein
MKFNYTALNRTIRFEAEFPFARRRHKGCNNSQQSQLVYLDATLEWLQLSDAAAQNLRSKRMRRAMYEKTTTDYVDSCVYENGVLNFPQL